MSTPRPTPETDAALVDHMPKDATEWSEHYLALSIHARKLERERDERREYAERCKEGCIKLSFAIDRIDYACGNPNEMEVSDYALHQNEDHVVQRVKEKLEAMREAIKKGYDALTGCVDDSGELLAEHDWWKDEPRCGYRARYDEHKQRIEDAEAALTKLQPFIKP